MIAAATGTFELIERARLGDSLAIQQLFQKYSRRLAVHIRFRLGPQARQYAEIDDIFQTTCLKAFTDFARFEYRAPGSFMRWLTSIADHVIADLARYQGRQKRQAEVRLKFRSESNPGGPEPIDTHTPSRWFAENEGLRRLMEQLDLLPDDYRDVILMAKVEGLSTQEMAMRLGKSPQATALLLHRAVKRLRQIREGIGDRDTASSL